MSDGTNVEASESFHHTRPSGFTLSFKISVAVFGLLLLVSGIMVIWDGMEVQSKKSGQLDAQGAGMVRVLALTPPESWRASRGTIREHATQISNAARSYGNYLEKAYGIVVDPTLKREKMTSLPEELKKQQQELLEKYEKTRAQNEKRLGRMMDSARVLDAYVVTTGEARVLAKARENDLAFRTKTPEGRSYVASVDGRTDKTPVKVYDGDLETVGPARLFSAPLMDDEGNVTHEAHVVLSTAGLGDLIDGFLVAQLLIALGLSAVAAIGCYFIVQKLTGPLMTLIHHVDALSAGDLGHRAHVHTDDEIGLLARTMEAMVRRIDRARGTDDSKIADKIHRKMMPEEVPFIDGYPVELLNKQIPEIGGTFHDFLYFLHHEFGFVIAQGSQTGIAAALNVLMAGTSLRAESRHTTDPETLLSRVNAVLYENLHAEMDVRMTLGLLDSKSGKMKIASAGGLPVLHYDARQLRVREFELEGLPLGQDPGGSFDVSLKAVEVDLGPGDRVFLTNGGLVSLVDDTGEELGEERLREFFGYSASGHDATETLASLRENLNEFLGEAKVDHDVVGILVGREGSGGNGKVAEKKAEEVPV